MEETDTPKIVDQALAHPIKYTLMLTKEVFALNKGLFLGITAIVILLSLLSNIPLLGLVASVLSGILMFALFFFVGKVFYEAADMDAFVETIRTTTISKLWSNYWKPSFGAYLGWVLIILLFLVIAGVIVGITGAGDKFMMASQSNDPMAMLAILPATILPLLLLALLLYVMPLVFANIIKTDNFNDAFKAVFTIFSKDVWRRAFTGAYFKYMTLLGLILIALMILMVVFSGILMTIFGALDPSMMIVGLIIVIILMVIIQIVMNIFYAISAVIADRMTR
jgi:hypothetical protein